jgi:hypothetical protein
MNAESLLLNEWRKLPAEKQQQVIDFVLFLESQRKEPFPSIGSSKKPKTIDMAETKLGDRLLKIRQKIVESGVPLLGAEEIEKEIAERRGGYRGGEV